MQSTSAQRIDAKVPTINEKMIKINYNNTINQNRLYMLAPWDPVSASQRSLLLSTSALLLIDDVAMLTNSDLEGGLKIL